MIIGLIIIIVIITIIIMIIITNTDLNRLESTHRTMCSSFKLVRYVTDFSSFQIS